MTLLESELQVWLNDQIDIDSSLHKDVNSDELAVLRTSALTKEFKLLMQSKQGLNMQEFLSQKVQKDRVFEESNEGNLSKTRGL